MYFWRTSSAAQNHPLGDGLLESEPPVFETVSGGKWPRLSVMYCSKASDICFILLWHNIVAAERRALFNAGRRMPTSRAMMPMTTSSSTRVNARSDLGRRSRRLGALIISSFPCSDVAQLFWELI